MKRDSIKWNIFKYNLIVIVVLILLTTIVFNFAIRAYIERDVIGQLNSITTRIERTALEHGPEFFPRPGKPPPLAANGQVNSQVNNDFFRYYYMLDRSLRGSISVLSADYILLDSNKAIVNPSPQEKINVSDELLEKIKSEMNQEMDSITQSSLNFSLSGSDFIAVVMPVSQKNSFGLGWIIIYSSLEKINQLQWTINIILLIILLLSAVIAGLISSMAAKKISAPFSSLNQYIREIADRNFGSKIHTPVYEELKEFVNNINTMSEKLETYDKSQKTFFQNASHEFRTPLMSIQSYAEGIRHDVVDPLSATEIILEETTRMTHLVEDLMYLSRLDAIEENDHFHHFILHDFIINCVERMNGIANKNNIEINIVALCEKCEIYGDSEKLDRAITNILSNCIRYATTTIIITIEKLENNIIVTISDDGPGFDNNELGSLFNRFYKGKKGKFGLGLAITKNIIEKHKGKITASNSSVGAMFTIDLPIRFDVID